MPIRHEIVGEPPLIMARGNDPITVDCVLDYAEAVARDPANRDETPELLDLTDVVDLRLTQDEIRRVSQRVEALYDRPKSSRLAVVADGPLAFGLSRVYGAFRAGEREVRVFRRIEEAHDWLR